MQSYTSHRLQTTEYRVIAHTKYIIDRIQASSPYVKCVMTRTQYGRYTIQLTMMKKNYKILAIFSTNHGK
ncbi:hypothetical protein CIPAW_09G147000 [Carya illinoinensis]|uniref:Uncharacterized protein n=1 Tax=Carya illinoinensis TaxID=32201 RepID=A0A8T1PLX6_CARIL|nr:hypothetical protein CIPAW_09G147000 [Carya illinoinensis]